jgi:5-methylcytosine-specific restriction endonuclease McrA
MIKPATEFHGEGRAKDGLAAWCKSCVSAYDREVYSADPEPARARAKVWAKDNPDKRRIISRCYYARNPEKAAAAIRRWKDANPERNKANKNRNQQQRRARQLGAARTEEWTTEGILERDGWTCRVPKCLCPDGRRIRPDAPVRWRGTADHVVPLARGGSDIPDNLRAAHQACNSGKNSALDEEETRPRAQRVGGV